MTWFQFVENFNQWWSTITFCTTVFFIVAYSLMASWWKTPMGSTIVGLDAAIACTVFPTFLSHVFGIKIVNDRATGVFLILVLSSVPCIILYRTWVLWRVQHSSLYDRVRARLHSRQLSNPGHRDQSGQDPE